MPQLANKKQCTGCMCCADTCKHGAIKIEEDQNGLWYPVVDAKKCTECHLCEKHCQTIYSGAILKKNPIEYYSPYIAWNNNGDQRKLSTSGGSFAAIASSILNEGGIICGATIENNRVRHIFISTEEELPLIQGVKYIQSNLEGVYQQVRKYIDTQSTILFSGTPCQVAALYTYLGNKRNYDNLYTAEVICHGVVSNLIVDKHLEYNHANQIVSFRSKCLGWGKDTYTTVLKNGQKTILQNRHKNFFYHAFTSDTVTRPSCYQCNYSNIRRVADITMGDYWGNKQVPEESIKGISLLITNNSKGEKLISRCPALHFETTEWKQCLPRNPRLYCDKHECQSISLTNHLHTIFTYTPRFLAKSIVGARVTKRNPIAFIRAYFIILKKKNIDKRVAIALEETIKQLKKK